MSDNTLLLLLTFFITLPLGAAEKKSATGERITVNSPDDFQVDFESAYNYIIIRREGDIVGMSSLFRGAIGRESAIDLTDSRRLVVPYTRALYTAALVQPAPREVLLIGLGGGGFNRFFATAYPKANLHSVEIDRKVVDLAEKYMEFKESPANTVSIMDGRLFVKRARDKTWDWIILDAFRSNVAPPHLKTVEFYEAVAERIAPGGVFLVNIHDDTELFLHDVVTLRKAFAQVVFFKVPETVNVIALAVQSDFPHGDLATHLTSRPAGPAQFPTLYPDLDLAKIRARLFEPDPAELAGVRTLTDDYAPVEFLNIKRLFRSKKK